MNTLAQVIYNLEHKQGNSRVAELLSQEEKRMLGELETLMQQTSVKLAEWLAEAPDPTDWAVIPFIPMAN